jgi:hypothetical protein
VVRVGDARLAARLSVRRELSEELLASQEGNCANALLDTLARAGFDIYAEDWNGGAEKSHR